MFNKSKILVKYRIALLEIISKRLLINYILNLFLTPPKSKIYKEIYKTDCGYDMIHVEKNIWVNTYSWGKNKNETILLAHAWGGNGTHMSKFVSPLLNAGYRVVAFDAPAHGLSSLNTCDMFQYANTVNTLCSKYSVSYIIAHSFGAACSILAINKFNLEIKGIVSLGCFSDAQFITKRFGNSLGIKEYLIDEMENLLENRYKNLWRWGNIAPVKMVSKISIPILFVHDENDNEVPYENAVQLVNMSKKAKILSTKKLGHRKIILHLDTIELIVDYIKSLERENDISL